jgi:DNA-directed RNA polymerase subunit N (RpoN/RPB10)
MSKEFPFDCSECGDTIHDIGEAYSHVIIKHRKLMKEIQHDLEIVIPENSISKNGNVICHKCGKEIKGDMFEHSAIEHNSENSKWLLRERAKFEAKGK